jgi:recombinational DNA repair ATPase RecF
MVQGAMMKLEDVGKNMMAAQPEDDTAQAWLTTVFARIQRRMENRAAALRNDRHPDWKERAVKDATAYADEQIAEMGERFASARSLVYEVLNGMAPDVAAASILKDRT